MILVWGPELIQIYNDAYVPLIGRKHPDALGMPTHACWPEIRRIQEPVFARVFAGQTVTVTDALYPLDRRGRLEDAYFDATFVPVPREDGLVGGSLSTLFETTQRVAAREAEMERERLLAAELAARADVEVGRARLDAVLSQLPVGVIIAESPSGRIVVVNDAVHRIWDLRGRTSSVDVYSLDRVGYHPNGRRLTPEEWPLTRTVRHGETILGMIIRVDRPGGAEAWIDVSSTPVRDSNGRVAAGVAIYTDISMRVQADRERDRLVRALDRERTWLVELFRQAPAHVAVLRGPNHVFEMVNEAYYRLVGRRDLIGKAAFDAIPDARDQGFEKLLEEVLATGEPVFGREMPLQLVTTPGAQSELHFVDFVYQALVDADGTRTGVIAFGTDVTEQVLARREVERLLAESERARAATEAARAEADAASRAKSQFLATMSHELRTPLNAIGGYAELLEMGVRGPVTDQQREFLQRIQASQRHLLGVINEVLNYTKLQTGTVRYDITAVRARDALASAEALVAPQARAKGLTLAVRECPPELTVSADEEKLRQILINLLSNAIKFTPPQGRIDLTCDSDDERVHLIVRDSGVGISAEVFDKIFEPFVQVHARLTRTTEGTGLGLAISRDLARGMGGDLTVESTIGEGSAFTLTLARASDTMRPGLRDRSGLAGT